MVRANITVRPGYAPACALVAPGVLGRTGAWVGAFTKYGNGLPRRMPVVAATANGPSPEPLAGKYRDEERRFSGRVRPMPGTRLMRGT